MTETIAQRELRNDNAKIIAAVRGGASFLVTRNGVPVAELRPVSAARQPFIPGSLWVKATSAGPSIDAAAFRADLDAAIDPRL